MLIDSTSTQLSSELETQRSLFQNLVAFIIIKFNWNSCWNNKRRSTNIPHTWAYYFPIIINGCNDTHNLEYWPSGKSEIFLFCSMYVINCQNSLNRFLFPLMQIELHSIFMLTHYTTFNWINSILGILFVDFTLLLHSSKPQNTSNYECETICCLYYTYRKKNNDLLLFYINMTMMNIQII